MKELHVFHYPGYSAVWAIQIAPTPVGEISREARDGDFVTREYLVFPHRAEAESHVGDFIETHYQDPDFSAANIHRYTPAPNKVAVRVEADDPEHDRILRGWLVYSPDGRHHEYVIDDDGKASLGEAGITTVLSEPIKLTAHEYYGLAAPF